MTSDQKLRKSNRISLKEDVQNILKNGNKFQIRPFVIFRQMNSLGYPRLVVSIRRQAGHSVLRHHVTRKIREYFRKNKALFSHYDYFLFTKLNLSNMTKEDWRIFFQSLELRLQKMTSTQKNS